MFILSKKSKKTKKIIKNNAIKIPDKIKDYIVNNAIEIVKYRTAYKLTDDRSFIGYLNNLYYESDIYESIDFGFSKALHINPRDTNLLVIDVDDCEIEIIKCVCSYITTLDKVQEVSLFETSNKSYHIYIKFEEISNYFYIFDDDKINTIICKGFKYFILITGIQIARITSYSKDSKIQYIETFLRKKT